MGAEIPDGAVIVARAIMNSSLWEMRAEDRIVALSCIVLCNKKPRKWFDGHRQILIDRGQFVGSVRKMAREANLPIQVVRTSLEHLDKSEFLTQKSTQGYTIFTVPKYEHYQDLTKYSDSGVRKPTQFPTRSQHTHNPKINTEFPQSLHNGNGHNDVEPKDLKKVCTTVRKKQAANQHTKNGKSNIKQQQQTKTKPPSSSSLDLPNRTAEGGAMDSVVVVSEKTDPILEKVCVRISKELLVGIRMAESVAHAFAAAKPVGAILGVVQQARSQKKPAGWARTSLENDWLVPDATGPELQEVIGRVKADVDRTNSAFMRKISSSGIKLETERRPGEDEQAWFRRVTDELNRKKDRAKNGRREG